jgi:hypothetical protein
MDYLDKLGIQRGSVKSASFSNGPSGPNWDLPEMKGSKTASFAAGAESQSDAPSREECEAEGPSTPSSLTTSPNEEVEAKTNGDVLSPEKGQTDFRMSFLRKLSYENVWVPPAKRLPSHQTVIIFDWDDTLLCTSFLNRYEGRPLSPAVQSNLEGIESNAKQLLELAMRLGHTYIITNAGEGWVEHSCAKWIPGLLPTLEKIEIISARSRYESLYPNDVSMWKIHAFRDLQRRLDLPIITNLNSMGDANYEMEATQMMGKEFSEALVKTIKLREHPSPEELLKELELVVKNFERIVMNARNLKIGLERKVGNSSP